MNNLIIYGAGDLGREYLWFLKGSATWHIAGFIDDSVPAGTVISGALVLGGVAYLEGCAQSVGVLCAVADPVMKKSILRKLVAYPAINFPIIVHPAALIADSASIGEGTVIGPGCVISVDTTLGRHVIVNQKCSISHHVRVGDYAMIAPGCNLGGHVTVGEGAALGIGCSVIPGVLIGEYSVLGAGAVVTKSIPPHCTAVGIPAVPMKRG